VAAEWFKATGLASFAGAATPPADAVHPSVAVAAHVQQQLADPASHPTAVTSTVAATSPPVDSSTTWRGHVILPACP
jgi:hypothetical protein